MDTLTIIAVFLIAWGALTLLVGLLKPKAVWSIGKVQGFVQLIGETGTTIFFGVVGAAALIGGVLILIL